MGGGCATRKRRTGDYERTFVAGEEVAAFVPDPLPPTNPPLALDSGLARRLRDAEHALGRLELAGEMVPSLDWFLSAYVRKEAVVSSQIEGTQATLVDLLAFEAESAEAPSPDVEEVCNYLDALSFARKQLAAVRTEGAWEEWLDFFLDGVATIAEEAVASARDLFALVASDRARVLAAGATSVAALRLLEALPRHPILTVASAVRLLEASKPTAGRAIDALVRADVLVETTGRRRDRAFTYQAYLDRLRAGTELERPGGAAPARAR